MRVWSCFESLGRGVAAGVDVPCWRRARGRARACKRLCCGHYGWERGWGRVSEYLFVTFSHMSKYAFIVVRCWRLEGVGFLHIALLRFCETVYGPFGRHSYNWAARTCLFLSFERKAGLLAWFSICFLCFPLCVIPSSPLCVAN